MNPQQKRQEIDRDEGMLLGSDTRCDFADGVNELHPNLSVEIQSTIINLVEEVAKAQHALTRAETIKEVEELGIWGLVWFAGTEEYKTMLCFSPEDIEALKGELK